MRTPRMRGTHLALPVGLAVGVVASALLTGCGSSDDTTSADFCKSVASLTSTVETINQSPVNKDTIPGVEALLDEIDVAVGNLEETAAEEYPDEVDAVTTTANDLDTAVTAAAEQPTAAAVDGVRTAMDGLTGAVDDVASSTGGSC